MALEGDSCATALAVLQMQARRHANKTAIAFGTEKLTYRQFLRLVDNAARHLVAFGIAKGSFFAAISQNRPEMMICYYAAAKIGAVFVPLNPNLTPAEVDYCFRHSGARVLFHDEPTGETARMAVAGAALQPIAILRQPVATALGSRPVIQPSDDFLVIYTSGTTGRPKAIVLDHKAQVDGPAALAQLWGLSEDDVTLVALPLGYLYGLSTAAAAGLQTGGMVAILPKFHPRDVLESLIAYKATMFHGVPTMFSMMLEYCEQNDRHFDLSFMREPICAGAPLPLEMRRRFKARFNKDLQNYYALTEAVPVFGKYASDPRPVPEGAVGRAAPGLRVRIQRPDGGECGVGEEGEVLVRAAATMTRYLNAPEQTRSAFQGEYFRSGDLGHRDADGYFHLTGRIKDVIIRGGANISPAEVESVLAQHPAVQDVAVIGVPDRIFGEVPVAFVVWRHQASATAEELIVHAEKTLSDFKIPRIYRFEDSLPMGKTGKVDRAALKARIDS